MRITNLLSDEAALQEVGRRLAAMRIARSKTQAQLALDAGVSKRTVERLEDGASVQLANLVRCLRALDRLEALEALLPEQAVNPLDLVARDQPRRRVRTMREPEREEPWRWGDEDDEPTGGAS